MEELESQVAKIQIGNPKSVASYVFILAEKAPSSEAELYVVAELPLFNPAAESSCESICLSIGSALKRAYKKGTSENVFETAVAQVNEELGKLAETGQTHWIDKLNCILAVKEDNRFSIATCGKVAAYLYRGQEFTDISCSPSITHPLKTFENVAFGKLKLEDVVILSTTQLFNHISIVRLQTILRDNNFLVAAQLIIEILKQNAGPEVAFGTVMMLQVEPGQTDAETINLDDYQVENGNRQQNIFSKTFAYIKTALVMDKNKRVPNVRLPQVSFSGSLQNVKDSTKTFTSKSKQLFASAGSRIKRQSQNLSIAQIKEFSRLKKFFLFSVIVLLIAAVASITISIRYKKTAQTQTQITNQLKDAQTLLSSAQASLLYKDNSTAENYLVQAQAKLPNQSQVAKADLALYNEVKNELSDLRQKLENTVVVQTSNLGSLGSSDRLLQLNNFLATQVNSTIISYDKNNGSISDSALLSSEKILGSVYIKNSTAVVYNGSALLVWDYVLHQFSPPFTTSVPDQNSFVALKYYATNSRVYAINKSSNQILSFLVGSGISKPVVASKNANDLGNALDFAIDGSIYVLNTNGVDKYQSGVLQDFHLPSLTTPFSGKGKITTDKTFANIYILDSGNNRIIVMDKKGNLVETLTSKDFTDLKDFQVDEKNKVAYVLNGSDLLKVTLP